MLSCCRPGQPMQGLFSLQGDDVSVELLPGVTAKIGGKDDTKGRFWPMLLGMPL